MSGWKVFLTVVVVLVVIGLLFGGGAALYRLGYAQGLATAAAAADSDQLPRLYGRNLPGLDGSRVQVWPYGGMMVYSRHMPIGMFGFVGWIIPMLLLAGVTTLIVLGIRALIRKPAGTELHAVAAPAPAIIEPTPAVPARRARKTKAS